MKVWRLPWLYPVRVARGEKRQLGYFKQMLLALRAALRALKFGDKFTEFTEAIKFYTGSWIGNTTQRVHMQRSQAENLKFSGRRCNICVRI